MISRTPESFIAMKHYQLVMPIWYTNNRGNLILQKNTRVCDCSGYRWRYYLRRDSRPQSTMPDSANTMEASAQAARMAHYCSLMSNQDDSVHHALPELLHGLQSLHCKPFNSAHWASCSNKKRLWITDTVWFTVLWSHCDHTVIQWKFISSICIANFAIYECIGL